MLDISFVMSHRVIHFQIAYRITDHAVIPDDFTDNELA